MTMYANNSNIAFLNCNVLYADNNIFVKYTASDILFIKTTYISPTETVSRQKYFNLAFASLYPQRVMSPEKTCGRGKE